MTPEQAEDRLIELMASCRRDPLKFVQIAYPWGEGELSAHKGPRRWQREVLEDIGKRLQDGSEAPQGVIQDVIREGVSSGHGIGKSALVAWLIDWAMSTHADTRGVVTANTENQLRTKTWAEVGKWHRMSLTKHWFNLTATALFSKQPEHDKTWRIDMVPWSLTNSEAFAGLHNEGKRILLIFDEASAIPDQIWEVAEGALTDENTEIIWCAFGNPTRNTGRFSACFGKLRHRWNVKQIDSRDVQGTNKSQFEEWVDDYGEDSDFVRVRVRGVFPRAGTNQFIPADVVQAAINRDLSVPDYGRFSRVLGVDVARFGDDRSVIVMRQGPQVYEPKVFRGIDTMTLVSEVLDYYRQNEVDLVFVDGVGIGAGVVDRLKEMNIPVVDVQAGSSAIDVKTYANTRAELWGRMRDWLGGSVSLPTAEMADDLMSIEYGFNNKIQIQLEKKQDMKKRGLDSPDVGDALALTFAEYQSASPVAVRRNIRPAPRAV